MEIERFRSEAMRFAGDLLIPRHDGIVVEQIPSSAAPGAGYLLVQVERSKRRPHRCEVKGEKQYFKRAGDSSFAMEHYDIEVAFKRFSVPKLKLGISFSAAVRDGAGRILKGRLNIYLENTSSVTARMPYLQIKNATGATRGVSKPENMLHHVEAEWYTYSGDASVVVHPGLTRTLAVYEINFDWSTDCKIEGQPDYLWKFLADSRFGCENSAAITRRIELAGANLVRIRQLF